MVTAAQAEKNTIKALAQALAFAGFERLGGHLLERARPNGVAWQLRCGARVDSASQQPLLTLSLGLRIEALEHFLKREIEPRAPTFSVPIHFLHEDRRLLEWEACSPNTINALADEVKQYGIPFLERYENLNNLLVSLESDDPARWVCVSSKERVELLIGVLFIAGRVEDALRVANREIETLRDRPPGHRRQLERLRERISYK